MARGTTRTHKAAHIGLTPARRAKATAAFRETGIYARAAEACGVADETLTSWRKKHPDFDAELTEAGRALDAEIGTLARNVLKDELEAFSRGDTVPTPVLAPKSERVVVLDMPRSMNVAAVRTALTKLDPAWTHPKQEIQVNQFSTALDALQKDE